MEITVLQAIGKIYTSRYRVERLSQTVDGLWRSLVAHYTGGVGVAGSNPVSPTNSGQHLHGAGFSYTASKIETPSAMSTTGKSTLSHFSSASAIPGRVATNRAAQTSGATSARKTAQ